MDDDDDEAVAAAMAAAINAIVLFCVALAALKRARLGLRCGGGGGGGGGGSCWCRLFGGVIRLEKRLAYFFELTAACS